MRRLDEVAIFDHPLLTPVKYEGMRRLDEIAILSRRQRRPRLLRRLSSLPPHFYRFLFSELSQFDINAVQVTI